MCATNTLFLIEFVLDWQGLRHFQLTKMRGYIVWLTSGVRGVVGRCQGSLLTGGASVLAVVLVLGTLPRESIGHPRNVQSLGKVRCFIGRC